MIDHIDPLNRLVYLDDSTVNATIQPIDIYREMRNLRQNDETLRPYDVFMTMKGAEKKNQDGTKRTERYLVLLEGTLIVPYDTSHTLTVDGTIITDSGLEGVQTFDRANLSAGTEVDINYVPKQVEVITTGGLDEGQLHTYLDSYTNKSDWKASDVTTLNAIHALKTLEPDERAALLALQNYDDGTIQTMINIVSGKIDNVPANVMDELV